MGQVVWVDDRVVHGIRRVDIDPTLAVWALESSSDTDGTVSVVRKQEFDLTNRAREDLVGRCVVYRLVTSDDTCVGAPVRREVVYLLKDAGLEFAESIAENGCGVHVCYGRVDVREEDWVVLPQSGNKIV